MNLIGLVIPGERIHHNVDAGAESHFALPVISRDHRIKWIAIVIQGPGCRIVIGTDNNGTYTVNIIGR